MNILMIHPHDIYSNTEPWTVRIVYIAREFIEKGHNVKLVFFPLGLNKKKPLGLSLEGLAIILLSRKYGLNIFISNIIKLYSLSKWADVIHFQ
jgi:hypothetical protein